MVDIVQTVEVATHLNMHTDPRLHPTRCRLFHRIRALVALDRILVARDRIKETLYTSSKRREPCCA